MRSFDDPIIVSERLTMTPLVPEDADEMVQVLADSCLHQFIGGRPANLDDLRAWYRKLVDGSPRAEEIWLNWIARRRADDQAVGTVQATVIDHGDTRTAYVAWVIGVPWQNHGFASEAARALVAWLGEHDVDDIVAHIHPDHRASAKVASRAGLAPTDECVDGEHVWRATTAR